MHSFRRGLIVGLAFLAGYFVVRYLVNPFDIDFPWDILLDFSVGYWIGFLVKNFV